MSRQKTPRAARCPAPWRRPPWRRSAWRSWRRGRPCARSAARSISVKMRSSEALAEAFQRVSRCAGCRRGREPMPRIKRALLSGAGGVDAAAHAADGVLQADEDRLADQEVADVELDAPRVIAATGADGFVVEAVAGVDLQPQPRRRPTPRAAAPPARPGPRPLAPPRTRRRCAARSPGRRSPRRRPICTGSGSMNRETRTPASLSFRTTGATTSVAAWRRPGRPRWSPPRAARARGRRRAAGARRAMASISSVTAISKFNGLPRFRRGRTGRRCPRRRCGGGPRAGGR